MIVNLSAHKCGVRLPEREMAGWIWIDGIRSVHYKQYPNEKDERGRIELFLKFEDGTDKTMETDTNVYIYSNSAKLCEVVNPLAF